MLQTKRACQQKNVYLKRQEKFEAKNRMCMTRAVSSSAMHEGKKDRSLLLVLHTAWRKVFFRSVCVARSEARGGSLDCREGGPCRFNSFQKSSSLYRRRLHANVGHPISFRTDTFDFVRRLARNIALATESWSLSTRRHVVEGTSKFYVLLRFTCMRIYFLTRVKVGNCNIFTAGPSGLNSCSWRRMCSFFKGASASANLCHAIAGLAKLLASEVVHPAGIDHFTYYCLGSTKGGATRLLGSFYSQAKAIDLAEKGSSSSSSGIDKAFEGERIITWTCAVLKECLRSQGGRPMGKKDHLFWEADRSLGDERLVCHLDWKFTPLGFYRAIFCHKNPEAATTLEKFCFWTLRQTTRQRSRTVTTALARVHRLHRLSYHLMVHILPICTPSRQLYEKLFSWWRAHIK